MTGSEIGTLLDGIAFCSTIFDETWTAQYTAAHEHVLSATRKARGISHSGADRPSHPTYRAVSPSHRAECGIRYGLFLQENHAMRATRTQSAIVYRLLPNACGVLVDCVK